MLKDSTGSIKPLESDYIIIFVKSMLNGVGPSHELVPSFGILMSVVSIHSNNQFRGFAYGIKVEVKV